MEGQDLHTKFDSRLRQAEEKITSYHVTIDYIREDIRKLSISIERITDLLSDNKALGERVEKLEQHREKDNNKVEGWVIKAGAWVIGTLIAAIAFLIGDKLK